MSTLFPTFDNGPAALTAQLQAEVLAEHQDWVRRLEQERWTTSDRDPDEALRELIRREGSHTTAAGRRTR
jgi:hypothetical protein